VSQETIATVVDDDPQTNNHVTFDMSNSSASSADISTTPASPIDSATPPPTYHEATSEQGKNKYPQYLTDDPPAYSEV
jgi:hypothetical protein